jgi:hypothetical protein
MTDKGRFHRNLQVFRAGCTHVRRTECPPHKPPPAAPLHHCTFTGCAALEGRHMHGQIVARTCAQHACTDTTQRSRPRYATPLRTFDSMLWRARSHNEAKATQRSAQHPGSGRCGLFSVTVATWSVALRIHSSKPAPNPKAPDVRQMSSPKLGDVEKAGCATKMSARCPPHVRQVVPRFVRPKR